MQDSHGRRHKGATRLKPSFVKYCRDRLTLTPRRDPSGPQSTLRTIGPTTDRRAEPSSAIGRPTQDQHESTTSLALRARKHRLEQPKGFYKPLTARYPNPALRQGGEGQVRLLQLVPGSETNVQYTLLPYYRSEAPRYHALSYAWGTGTDYQRIHCNGQMIKVSRTVSKFLQRMRNCSSSEVPLWIDSICINQADLLEKADQVGAMGGTFAQAELVQVWLGESDSDTAVFADVLARRSDQRHLSDMERLSVSHLLYRSWFERTWVLQEVLLARQCQVHCGSYTWSWEELSAAAQMWSDTAADLQGWDWRSDRGVLHFSAVYKDLPKHDMVQLLAAARISRATDARDKVYAVLQLVQYAKGSFVDKKLSVDYREPTGKLYKRTAARCLQNGHLSLFNAAGHDTTNPIESLPSWVPDWSNIRRPYPLWRFKLGSDAMAGGNGPAAMPIVSGLETVLVECLIFDVVRKVGTAWTNVSTGTDGQTLPLGKQHSNAQAQFAEWHQMTMKGSVSKSEMFSKRNLQHNLTFTQTITAAAPLATHLSSDERGSRSMYEAYNAHMLAWKVPMQKPLRRGASAQDMKEQPRTTRHYFPRFDAAVPTGVADFHRLAVRVCQKRTMYVTEAGHMGLGPGAMKRGDVIVIVPGAPTPLVIRTAKATGHSILMGECYVHGIMNGEAMLMRLESEMITLV